MSLFFCGYFDAKNTGDDWLLDAGLSLFSHKGGPQTITILGHGAKAGPAPNTRFINRHNPVAVLNAVRKCRAMVVPGGSLFQDHSSSRSFLYYYTLVKMAKRLRKPVHLIAQGIEPFRHTRTQRLLQSMLKQCDTISVRDKASCDYLSSLGIHSDCRADLALTMIHAFPEPTMAPIKPELGVILRPANWPSAVKTALNQVPPKWALAMQAPEDRVATRELYGGKTPELTNMESINTPPPSPVSMVLTNRYHGALWAVVHGLPFCVIAPPNTKGHSLAMECGQAFINPYDPEQNRETVLAYILAKRNETAKYQNTLLERRSDMLSRAHAIKDDIQKWTH